MTKVYAFISRIVFGTLIAIFLGSYLDDCFGISPLIMILLMLYVVIGSLVKLIKDSEI